MSEGNKEKHIPDLHKEIIAGKQLEKSNEQEMEEMNRDRKARMEKVAEVKILFDNAQSVLDELLSKPASLSKVPEIDIKAIQMEKTKRLQQIETLRDTFTITNQLMDEIKGGVNLSPPPKSDQNLDAQEKAQRMDLFLQANTQLQSFGTIVDEISRGEFELQKVDPVEQKAHEEARRSRLVAMKEEVDQFQQFGSLLEDLSSGQHTLQKIDEKELAAHRQATEARMETVLNLKSKIEIATELINEITNEMELEPIQKENLKQELFVKFELANTYLGKIRSENAEKFKKLSSLQSKIGKIQDLFSEMKETKLQPISLTEKEQIAKEQKERKEQINQIETKIAAKFDITNKLLQEIQSAPILREVSVEELEQYNQHKFKRMAEIDYLKSHMNVVEDLMKSVRDGIHLTEIDENEMKAHEQAKQERLNEIGALKGKLDVMGEMMDKIVQKSILLSKIDEKELHAHEEAKQDRMKQIIDLKELLKAKGLGNGT
ncbi:MAG: hypothetical protein ACTSWW_04720 [Promethearchaeota archaeon]